MADEEVQEEDIVEEVVEGGDQPVDPAALQASDLNTMATVLEAVAQRGAVRAGEMELVGALYNKLMAFLIANGLRPQPGAEAAPVEGANEAVEEAPVEAPEETEDA